MHHFTNFLYAQPSLFEGLGRVLDIGDTLTHFNTAVSGEQADAIAMYTDWLAVGSDLRAAADQVCPVLTYEVKGVIRAQAK